MSDSANVMDCAICGHCLDNMTEGARQEHYETHFDETPPCEEENLPLSASATASGSNSPSTLATPQQRRPLLPIGKNGGKFWTVSRSGVEKPPANITPGLIPIIKRALEKSHAKGTTRRAALCQKGISHIATEFFDITYGCG